MNAIGKLPPPGDPRALYVIDISGYVFRAYHALPPLQSPQGEPTHAVLGVTTMVQKLIADQKPQFLAVAMDSKTRSFRHSLYEAYKATRPAAPPDLGQQITRLREIIDAFAIPVLYEDGVEADDLIATLVQQGREHGQPVVIVSADKDMLQLVGDGVLMYDTSRNLVYGVEETEAKLGVPPAQVRDYLALVGDTSDNVPGVRSVGPKTAVQLLQQFGSIDGIYANLDQITKKALREKLELHREDAFLSRELVTLRGDCALGVEISALARQAPDTQRLQGLYRELGFVRLIEELPASKPAPPTAAEEPVVPAEPALLITTHEQLRALGERLATAERLLLSAVTDDAHAVRAGLVGLVLAVDDEQPAYVPVGHTYLGHPEQLPLAHVLETVAPALRGERPRKLCIDAKRDLIVLAQHGIDLGGIEFDARLASYLADAERHGHSLRELAAEFGLGDVSTASAWLAASSKEGSALLEVERAAGLAGEAVHALRRILPKLQTKLEDLECERLLHELELPLARVLSEIERTGVLVDVQRLTRLSGELATQLGELERRCTELAGHEFNVGSPRQLEAILFDQLKLPVIKRTKTARSTDADVLEELAVHHELPAAILEHRTLAKLKSTYLDALPREINPKTGRIHTDFRQTVAATGRLSSSEPNLQNIPIRTDIGRSIRDAFVAREGFRVLSADYSQIELRVLAHLTHDPELVAAFSTDTDVHVRTARAIFGVPEAEVTREMRAQSKTVNFAVIYGQTQFALARNLRIERSEAARYIKAFFEQYAGVRRYMDEVVDQARRTGQTRTLLGRVRRVPDLLSRNRVQREAAERIVRNTPIQGSAADIIKLAMVAIGERMRKEKLRSRMLLTVHDELVFEAPREEEAVLEALVVESMESALKLDVPLKVDRGWGESWGAAH
ncbi:MAG TPA: DNA polymerase I [Polyangiales bacterium]|nr:DNA polymerase I [Polyangiales bacterium]